MKRIHGTYSIQPGTITNDIIADDAAISESKIALSYSTGGLDARVTTVSNDLSTHTSSSTNPHGTTLSQTNLINVSTITAAVRGLTIDGTVKLPGSVTIGTLTVSTSATGKIHAEDSDKLGGIKLSTNSYNDTANSVPHTDSSGFLKLAKIKADVSTTASPTAILALSSDEQTVSKISMDSISNTLINSKIVCGIGYFNGTVGRQIDFGINTSTYVVTITAEASTEAPANVGNISVAKSAGSFKVINTGTYRGAFDYIVVIL